MTVTLPPGFTVRPVTIDDLKPVNAAIATCQIADGIMQHTTEDSLSDFWLAPNFNMTTDTWVVVAPDGRIAGYTYLLNPDRVRLKTALWVPLEYYGQGVRTCLLQLVESRANQLIAEAPPNARVSLHSWVVESNHAARQFFEQAGYTVARGRWTMKIVMQEPPPLAIWPKGITVRTFKPGQDERALFNTIDEAFHDIWGYIPMSFEGWEYWTLKNPDFNPSLWFLACDGDEVAAAACCIYLAGQGWVDDLGVRRPWRRRGLGLALLHHAFGEFYRRGMRHVGLNVDSQSLTGANRLYKRAGMHVAQAYLSYEKELRPGEELGMQSITV